MSRERDFLLPGNYENHDGITIRRARQEDKGALWHIHTRAIREVCKSHYSERELQIWTDVLRPARYQEPIKKGPFYVAIEGGSIIGFGNLNQKSGEIEALYVDPDYVGRGVGMRILKALENAAVGSGLKLLCLSSSLNAVKFYEMAGYKRQKQKRCLLPFEMVSCVPMIKEL
ncbi:MAG: GNAT family N-acetyltransferase [Deltaproteobacteria bacterium]|jgi:GNAT superfamily N-acetyltransferase